MARSAALRCLQFGGIYWNEMFSFCMKSCNSFEVSLSRPSNFGAHPRALKNACTRLYASSNRPVPHFIGSVITVIIIHSKEILVSGAGLHGKPSCAIHEMFMRALYPGIYIVCWHRVARRKGVSFCKRRRRCGCDRRRNHNGFCRFMVLACLIEVAERGSESVRLIATNFLYCKLR